MSRPSLAMTQKFSQGRSTDTQAPPRAFPSSLGHTPELSQPGKNGLLMLCPFGSFGQLAWEQGVAKA